MPKPPVFYARSRIGDEDVHVSINHRRIFEQFIGRETGLCYGLTIAWLCAMITSYSEGSRTRGLVGDGVRGTIPTILEFYTMARTLFAKALAEAEAVREPTAATWAAAEAATPAPQAVQLLQFIDTLSTYGNHFERLSFIDGVLNLHDPGSVEMFFHLLSQQSHHPILCATLGTPNHIMALFIQIRDSIISISFYDPNTNQGELRTTFDFRKPSELRIRNFVQMLMESEYIKTFAPGVHHLFYFSLYKPEDVHNFWNDVLNIGGRRIPKGAGALTTQYDDFRSGRPKPFLFTTITDQITANFALFMATYHGNAVLVGELLADRYHADPNAHSMIGWTPLHHAAWFGYLDIAARLLNKNADPNLRISIPIGRHYFTPLRLARKGHHASIMALLESRGARLK